MTAPVNCRTLELSVVMTLDDRYSPVGRIVAALASDNERPASIELIVVHAEDRAGLVEVLSGIEPAMAARVHLRMLSVPRPGRAAAWNRGIDASTAPIIWILADDFIPQPGCLVAHRRFHETHPDERCVAVGPAYFPVSLRHDPFRRWLEDSGALFGASFTCPVPEVVGNYFYGGNVSLKRSFFQAVGPFDEEFCFHTTDDYEFSVRARQLGMTAAFVKEAAAIHEHPVSVSERMRSHWQAGFSNVHLERKHPVLPRPSDQHRHSTAGYRLRSWAWWLCHQLTRRPEHQIRYWQNALSMASVQGYQAGKK